jgi:transposase-like protein
MAKQQGTTLRYSISFKQKVVKEIEEEGLPFSEAMRRYGIRGGQTIQKWSGYYKSLKTYTATMLMKRW